MLKKQDVQGLLDSLPEEFSADDLLEGLYSLEPRRIPDGHRELLIETTKKTLKSGGIPIEVYEAKMDEWRAELLSQMQQ